MNYSKLPPINNEKSLKLDYFPDAFHAAVFRFWETVSAENIARALYTDIETINKTASDMGLPKQKHNKKWEKLGYITTIRNAWHILPYDQLLLLLGWDEDKLSAVLKEDDFLDIKLGSFKPCCEKVVKKVLDDEGKRKLAKIKSLCEAHFSDFFEGKESFDFFSGGKNDVSFPDADNLRLIYSYCGLYAGVLDNDIEISYPDELFSMYASVGVNAVWLPVVLYQMVEFPFDRASSEGYKLRQQRLMNLCEKAKKYGIKMYLYLNEPRCMPLSFFDNHPELLGKVEGPYGALCTSNKAVMDYLRYAVGSLCKAVPDIGGFVTITCSENLTHCKSREMGTECPVCKDVPISHLVSDVLTAISEESRKVNPDIRTIAWTWAWDAYMTDDERRECIDRLPKEVIIQCNSEAKKEFTIGGVSGSIADYSMSIPGPASYSKDIWEYAREKGHEVCAKVQVNVTWECSTVPFLPVFDLIREHMTNLRSTGVKHVMLSWTLGGYPSVNLKVASEALSDPGEEKYDLLLKEEFGEYASTVKCAAKIFSDAFREFPFHIRSLYLGPQNAGPANLLYYDDSGFNATMTCFAYDDLENWRAIYPADIYINQWKKLSEGWKKGLEVIGNIPECEFTLAAKGAYNLFRSSYLQAQFINDRKSEDKNHLSQLVKEEQSLALSMYELMTKSCLFGYEAANHYYFNKGALAEKVINCEYILEKLK